MKLYIYAIKNLKKANLYFNVYKPEDEDVAVYALPITIDKETRPVKHVIKQISKAYTRYEEGRAEFEENGYKFKKESRKKDEKNYVFVPSEKDYAEMCSAQLCFTLIGKTRKFLFINAIDKTEYYDAATLEECCGDLIKEMLDKGIIYKKRCPKKAKK